MILPGVPRQATTTADPALLKALSRAFRWKRMLDEGRYASVSDIERAEKLDRTYVGDIRRLTLLTPNMVEGIVEGRQPAEMTLPALMRPWPVEWAAQVPEWWTAPQAGGHRPEILSAGQLHNALQ
jgi:hypothetical protein